jgi:HAD superfamily hydrolase (TIGR01493 family)
MLSAELVHAYKPDPRVHLAASQLLDVPPTQVLMVAAHGRDADGACWVPFHGHGCDQARCPSWHTP